MRAIVANAGGAHRNIGGLFFTAAFAVIGSGWLADRSLQRSTNARDGFLDGGAAGDFKPDIAGYVIDLCRVERHSAGINRPDKRSGLFDFRCWPGAGRKYAEPPVAEEFSHGLKGVEAVALIGNGAGIPAL